MRKFRTKSVAGGYAFAGLLAVAAMNGCDQQTIYRTGSGLTYRVWHRQPHGPVAGSGATVKVRYRELHADTPYDGTGGRMPLYQPMIPGLVFPYTVGEALGGARAGDSIVYTRRVDQLLARGILKKLPPGWNSSDEPWGRSSWRRSFRLILSMGIVSCRPISWPKRAACSTRPGHRGSGS